MIGIVNHIIYYKPVKYSMPVLEDLKTSNGMTIARYTNAIQTAMRKNNKGINGLE